MAQTKEHTTGADSPLTRASLLLLSASFCSNLYADLDANDRFEEMDNILVFTDGGSLVTLTNNHHLLPANCLFKGRTNTNSIDPVTTMIWYIETSRKYRANYLLANRRYESLWAYQCSQQEPSATQEVE